MDTVFEYLLKISWDGEIRCYAYTTPRRVDGLAFGPGLLSLSLPTREASLGGFGGSGAGISFELALEDTDVWQLAQGGVRMQRSTVQLWAWLPGQTLDEAVEIFKGQVSNPEWNFDDGVFSAAAVAPTFTSDVPFPPALMNDEGRFDLEDEALDGSKRLAVPVIYGTAKGSPLIPLEVNPGIGGGTARFLVAGHKVVEQTIQPMLEGSPVGGSRTVYNDGVDGLGNPYSYIKVPGVHYDVDLYAESIEGKVAPDGNAISKLGDVLIDMWLSFGQGAFYDLDRSRVYAARSILNRYRVGFFINSRTDGQTLIDLLASRFAQQYPVVFGPLNGRYGWDAVFVPPQTQGSVLHLIYGQNIHSRSPVVETPAENVINRFSIEYGHDGYAAGSLGSLKLDDSNDGICRGSISRWGKSPIKSFLAGDVPDSGTAFLLAEDEARRFAVVRQVVTYSIGDPSMLTLPLFSVVEVTDGLLGWSREKMLIEALIPRPNGRVDIRLTSLRGL